MKCAGEAVVLVGGDWAPVVLKLEQETSLQNTTEMKTSLESTSW